MIIIYLKTITPLKFRHCRQCCHFANPLVLVASLMPFSRPSLVSNVLFKLIALKFSMRLSSEAFMIGISRRRQELGRILNFKCV